VREDTVKKKVVISPFLDIQHPNYLQKRLIIWKIAPVLQIYSVPQVTAVCLDSAPTDYLYK
jgi:hypothetical protein